MPAPKMQKFQTFVSNLEIDVKATQHHMTAIGNAAAKLLETRKGRGRTVTAASKARNAFLEKVVAQTAEVKALLGKKLEGIEAAKRL